MEDVVYSPAAQTVQLVAPLEEKLPAAQFTGAREVDGHCLPAGQSVQEVLFPSEYCPAGQGVGNAVV